MRAPGQLSRAARAARTGPRGPKKGCRGRAAADLGHWRALHHRRARAGPRDSAGPVQHRADARGRAAELRVKVGVHDGQRAERRPVHPLRLQRVADPVRAALQRADAVSCGQRADDVDGAGREALVLWLRLCGRLERVPQALQLQPDQGRDHPRGRVARGYRGYLSCHHHHIYLF